MEPRAHIRPPAVRVAFQKTLAHSRGMATEKQPDATPTEDDAATEARFRSAIASALRTPPLRAVDATKKKSRKTRSKTKARRPG